VGFGQHRKYSLGFYIHVCSFELKASSNMETITITITAQTLNAIGAGLNELPYKVANPAIAEIQAQVKSYLENKNVNRTDSNPGSADEKHGGIPSADGADVGKAEQSG
jgi:hypothetical protein